MKTALMHSCCDWWLLWPERVGRSVMKDGVQCVAVLTRLLYGVQCMWSDWEKNCLFSIPIQGCICVGLPEDSPLLHRPTLRPKGDTDERS